MHRRGHGKGGAEAEKGLEAALAVNHRHRAGRGTAMRRKRGLLSQAGVAVAGGKEVAQCRGVHALRPAARWKADPVSTVAVDQLRRSLQQSKPR